MSNTQKSISSQDVLSYNISQEMTKSIKAIKRIKKQYKRENEKNERKIKDFSTKRIRKIFIYKNYDPCKNIISKEVKNSNPINKIEFQTIFQNNDLYYLDKIIETLIKREFETNRVLCSKEHKIDEKLRSKMIDWMIEILSVLKINNETLFTAISYMDIYFFSIEKIQNINDLHLIGMVSIFIATKFKDVLPLKLDTIQNQIGHQKFKREEIKDKEFELLNILQFNLEIPNVLDFIQILFQKIIFPKSFYDNDNCTILIFKQIISYFSKIILYDLKILHSYRCSFLAAGIFFISFKLLKGIDNSFNVMQNIEILSNILKMKPDDIFSISNRILALFKDFNSIYGVDNNLNKFNEMNFQKIKEIIEFISL